MKRIVILISGQGSNMQAVVRACQAEAWPAQVVGVLSNRPQAQGLAWAAEQGLHTEVIDHTLHADRASFDAALARAIATLQADLVVLAGFMRILTDNFVLQHAGRMLNVHPSLLPAFAGLHTHQRALDAGCHLAGATVHFVTPELDHGPIVAQAAVPVRADDTADTLAERVRACEHRILPMAVGWFVRDELTVTGLRVRQQAGAPQWLLMDAA